MNRPNSRGFTLIELLVVIAIIGILSSVVLSSLNQARIKSRDANRKIEMLQIRTALDLYYNNHGSYPSTGMSCAQCGATYSTQAGWLAPLVTDGDLPSAPVDPVNVDQGPWCYGGANSKSTLIMYASDGTHYILCAWLENTSDPSTLQYKDVPDPWNSAHMLRADDNYSNYELVYTE